jgi:WD40 repeat protein/predicted Ser/Thr protein kinase
MNTERERLLDEVVTAYLKAAEAGRAPDRAELLARHPELAAELVAFFEAESQVGRAAAPLRVPAVDEPPTAVGEPQPTGPGTRVGYFGDYELLEEIGRGGMGVVYKARQVSLNRVVALKMILTGQLADDADVKRFHAEAEAAARLDHPGIVPVFEVGKHDGHHYFSMAFVEGESLAREMVDGLPRPRDAARLLKQVAEAVTYAHVEGVVHRDLKPANILIDRNGQPRLTDFGLAKRVEGGGGLTQTGQIVGTPSYMPPEQANGQRDVGPLADVYSLGAVLYCLLTGRPPFQADNALDTLLQVLDRDPVPPRQLNAAVPRDLNTVCLKCLEKEPRKRYGSARELVADLGRYLDGRPILARPASMWERTVKWVCRRPAAAALVGVSVAAAVVLLVGGLGFNAQLQRALGDVARKQTDLDRANGEVQSALGDLAVKQKDLDEANGRAKAHEQNAKSADELAQAQARKAQGVLLTAQSVALRPDNPGLALLLAVEGAQRHRDLLANHALWDALEACREERTLIHPCAVHAAEFSPDGKWALTCGGDGAARVWDVATGREICRLKDCDVPVVIGHFSPNGRRVLTISHPRYDDRYEREFPGKVSDVDWKKSVPVARLWDPADGKLIASWWQPHRGGKHVFVTPLTAEFSPDSKIVATAFGMYPDGIAEVRDAETGKLVCTLAGHKWAVVSAEFSPDSRRVVTASIDETARIYEADTGKLVHELKGHTTELAAAGFGPNGKRVVTYGHGFTHRQLVPGMLGVQWRETYEHSAARLWDAETGKELPGLNWPGGARNWVWSVSFSHDGSRIVTAGREDVSEDRFAIWDAANGKRAVNFKSDTARRMRTNHAVFSPDDRRVASASAEKAASIWDAATGEELLVLPGHQEAVRTVAFSRDGRWLITTGDDNTARIWDVAERAVSPRRRMLSRLPSLTFFGLNGNHAYCFGRAGGRVSVLDTATGEEIAHGEVPSQPFGLRYQTGKLASKWLAFRDPQHDSAVLVFDGPSMKQRFTLDAHDKPVSEVFYGPDTKHPRLATVHVDGKARIWSLTDGKLLHTLAVDAGHPVQCALFEQVVFSGDGRRLLTVDPPEWDGRVKDGIRACVWSADTGERLATLKASKVDEALPQLVTCAISRDGKQALITWTAGHAARTWNVETGEEMHVLDHALSAAFSPDGKRIVTGGGDQQARIWDAATGRLIHTLDHEANVWHVEFSPDGKLVLTGAEWKGLRVWDAASGQLVAHFRDPTGMVRGAFSPDGKEVFTAYVRPDGTCSARFWPLDPVAEAIRRKPRELTEAERQLYGLGPTGRRP